MYLNLTTATKDQIAEAAQIDSGLMKMLGGMDAIHNREIEALRSVTEMYFALNTEVGAFYDKNGF